MAEEKPKIQKSTLRRLAAAGSGKPDLEVIRKVLQSGKSQEFPRPSDRGDVSKKNR